MKRKALAVLILASLMYGLTGAVNAYKAGFTGLERARCHTDTECMALCPRNAPDCDGGPQS